MKNSPKTAQKGTARKSPVLAGAPPFGGGHTRQGSRGAIERKLNGVPGASAQEPGIQNRDEAENRRIAIMNRVASAASALTDYRMVLESAARWRERYNPLRGLDIQRAISLLEEGERGAYAELQWLYRHIEMQDATLGALIERRCTAVEEMDWNIGISDAASTDEEKALAEKQQAALKDLYAGIGNMQDAIENLCLAAFRGFAHLEKVYSADGDLISLELIPQWHWCRDGISGKWELNIDSRAGATRGAPVDTSRLVIRECARPINRVALISYVRKNLSQKDWDGFVETFGIPAIFLILPPELGEAERDEFQTVAEQIVSDARGVLPGNSKVETVDNGARGANPFRDHIKYQDEQMVLRGTGGKLTMLAESGSGTLAGGAHADTFQTIARAEARKISEIFRQAIDRPFLEERFPGQPILARFEIAANEETDVGEVIKGAAALNGAGYKVRPEWLADKTGYEIQTPEDAAPVAEVREVSSKNGAEKGPRGSKSGKPTITNREADGNEDIFAQIARSIQRGAALDLADAVPKLVAALQADEAAFEAAMQNLAAMADDMAFESPAAEAAWEQALSAAILAGWDAMEEESKDKDEA